MWCTSDSEGPDITGFQQCNLLAHLSNTSIHPALKSYLINGDRQCAPLLGPSIGGTSKYRQLANRAKLVAAQNVLVSSDRSSTDYQQTGCTTHFLFSLSQTKQCHFKSSQYSSTVLVLLLRCSNALRCSVANAPIQYCFNALIILQLRPMSQC